MLPCEPEAVLSLNGGDFQDGVRPRPGSIQSLFSLRHRDTIEDTLRCYMTASRLAREGKLRNGSPEIAGIHLNPTDIASLAAFLRSLNEDYR